MSWLPAAFLVSGCTSDWRPSGDAVATRPADEPIDLAPYLRASRAGWWVYERQKVPAKPESVPETFVRRISHDRQAEGALSDRTFLPLDRYLTPPKGTESTDADGDRPPVDIQDGTVIFFRLQEPAAPVPPEARLGDIYEFTTPITYFNYKGEPIARGRLVQRLEIEGIEDIECPAGRFEECLRVRLELAVRFPLVAAVDMTGYLWFSPEVGEVRRVQRFSGLFLIFWFGRTDEYRLVSHRAPRGGPALDDWPPAKWSTGVCLFTEAYPEPKLAGMVVDFAPPEPSTSPSD